MNFLGVIKSSFFSVLFLSTILYSDQVFATDWSEHNELVSCQSGQSNMSDAAVGNDHGKPFSYTSSDTPPHSGCYATPTGYEINLYKIGMCTSDPFHSTDADVSFSDSSCTWTMESENGTSVDIAATLNQSIALPSAAIRPPNGIYSHFVMVMSNFINIKGSYTTTDATNGGIFYTKQSPNPASTNSPGLFDKTLTSSQFFKHEFDQYGFNTSSPCKFSYQRTISTGTNQGLVRAAVTNDSLTTTSSCSSPTRVVGAYKPTSTLEINDSTNGLEIQFNITGSGLWVEGGGSGDSTYQPNWAYAGDFAPFFTKF